MAETRKLCKFAANRPHLRKKFSAAHVPTLAFPSP